MVHAAGCGMLRSSVPGSIELETRGVSTEKPGKVTVFVSARVGDQPLAELDAEAFRLYEDGQRVDPVESQQTLLGAAAVAEYRTLLLLDLSGPLPERKAREATAHATAAFVEKVTEAEPVSVYAYAGDERPSLIGDYPRGRYTNAIDVELAVQAFIPRDASRDLGSALVQGMKELTSRLKPTKKPFRIGTLVVFARGPDLAGRVSEPTIRESLERSSHQVVAIAVGDPAYLRRWGRSGVLSAESPDDLVPVFEDAANLVLKLEWSHYLLSYCSPSRSGRRALRVEVTTDALGGGERKGEILEEIDATGFGPGCNAKTTPRGRFVTGAAGRKQVQKAKLPRETASPTKRAGQPRTSGSSSAREASPQEPPIEIVPPPDTPDYAQ